MFADLTGRAAVVTGSSGGIGAAIAAALAEAGASVVVTYRSRREEAESVAGRIARAGGTAVVRELDVADRSSLREAVVCARETFGRLDILVNNAGILKARPFTEITEADWDETLNVNARSVLVATQEALPDLKASRGAVVNITSIGGQIGGIRAPHYAASKAAIISLTRSCARLFAADGVRVNAIAPGYIETELLGQVGVDGGLDAMAAEVPLGALGSPSDIGDAVRFLASDAASHITGHILNVNGGLYLG
jgi:3-oxoacyl-[acyl-carrier protein] reductase